MRFLFELNHPKHYYQFKFVMLQLRKRGHEVKVVARDKDVLIKVLEEEQVDYEIFGQHRKKMYAKVLGTIPTLMSYSGIVKRFNPDVIISKASFYAVCMAKLHKSKSVIFPDSEVVKVTNRYVVPLATKVVTPSSFGLNYGEKHVRIKGFFEDCYLAPSVFVPDKSVIERYQLTQPYAIFRFVGWYANHDVGNNGFSLEQKMQMVREVEKYMKVYISSEKPLPEELECCRLPIPASLMHHALAFADLYLGDSQTMATEAALLGTPAVRSNSFVGENDMTNFKVLESQYGLLRNIKSFDAVLETLKDFASNSRKKEWVEKKESYFQSIGDPNEQIVEILLGL